MDSPPNESYAILDSPMTVEESATIVFSFRMDFVWFDQNTGLLKIVGVSADPYNTENWDSEFDFGAAGDKGLIGWLSFSNDV